MQRQEKSWKSRPANLCMQRQTSKGETVSQKMWEVRLNTQCCPLTSIYVLCMLCDMYSGVTHELIMQKIYNKQ
ncbi:hypothetical protein LEMLEM_LOCUS19093 [Lemmus lemmus]